MHDSYQSGYSKVGMDWHPSARTTEGGTTSKAEKRKEEPTLAQTIQSTESDLRNLMQERLHGQTKYPEAAASTLVSDMKKKLKEVVIGGRALGELARVGTDKQGLQFYETGVKFQISSDLGTKSFELNIYFDSTEQRNRFVLQQKSDSL